MTQSLQLQRCLLESLESGRSCAVVTLISKSGSVPQDPGAKCLITADSILPLVGTVGGGSVEAKAIKTAQQLLEQRHSTPLLLEWNLRAELGMKCGGAVQLLFETYFAQPSMQVVVFGSGHIAQVLVPMLCQLDTKVICMDERDKLRESWLEKIPIAANLQKNSVDDWHDALANLDKNSFFISVSRGFELDLKIAKALYAHCTPCYFAVIGSSIKGLQLKRDLLAAGISEEKLSNLYCPAGLPLGRNQPIEIAISICGQLLQKRDELKK